MLGQLNQTLDRMDTKLEELRNDVVEIKLGQVRLESELKGDIKTLESELKGEIKALKTEVNGIGKRLDTQEFINRSVVVGFILAGAVKIFLPIVSS